ncbi:Cyclase-like protein 2 [Dionaea muscipula]
MAAQSLLLLFLHLVMISTISPAATTATISAYPSGHGPEAYCRVHAPAVEGVTPLPQRREVYGNGRIYDISHRYTPNMPAFDSADGIGQFLRLDTSMKNGSFANISEMKLISHSGTHVDAPGHFYDTYFDAGYDVDTLDLDVLNGPALLVDVPRDTNITAEAMESLHIPKGVIRVLFRTLNSDRELMFKKEFDSSYTGFMKDGAQWLVDNTDIKLVGIDYLSVAAYEDLISAHLVFLESKEVILVEGLKLDNLPAGIYGLHCLPLRLLGADGSPVRCILMK